MRPTVLSIGGASRGPSARSRALRGAGFDVVEARTGQEALELAGVRAPLLVLLHDDLPGRQAASVYRRLKGNAATARTPVVRLVRPSAGPTRRVRALASGADVCLPSSTTHGELVEALRSLAQPPPAPRPGSPIAGDAGFFVEILESFTDGFFVLDREWRFVYASDRGLTLLGKTRVDLLGRTLWEAFPPVVGTAWDREYHRAFDENVAVHFEAYYPPFDTWFETHACAAQGRLTIFLRDVSSRRRSQEVAATHARQQAAVSRLGLQALAGTALETLRHDLQALFDEAVRLVAHTLGVECTARCWSSSRPASGCCCGPASAGSPARSATRRSWRVSGRRPATRFSLASRSSSRISRRISGSAGLRSSSITV